MIKTVCPELVQIWDTADYAVALKDDDADDDEDIGVTEEEKRAAAREKVEAEEAAKRKPRDVLPTGKVVGVIKRNWRACVALLPSDEA